MGRTSDLRRELKRTFIPCVEGKGFCVDNKDAPMFMRFRRGASNGVHLFEIQWDKYGLPRFVINFGLCSSDGLEIQGELFTPEQLAVGWLPKNGRLQPRRGAGTGSWFRQDKSFLIRVLATEKLRPPSEIVDELMYLFREVEAFWADGSIGAHLRIVGDSR